MEVPSASGSPRRAPDRRRWAPAWRTDADRALWVGLRRLAVVRNRAADVGADEAGGPGSGVTRLGDLGNAGWAGGSTITQGPLGRSRLEQQCDSGLGGFGNCKTTRSPARRPAAQNRLRDDRPQPSGQHAKTVSGLKWNRHCDGGGFAQGRSCNEIARRTVVEDPRTGSAAPSVRW